MKIFCLPFIFILLIIVSCSVAEETPYIEDGYSSIFVDYEYILSVDRVIGNYNLENLYVNDTIMSSFDQYDDVYFYNISDPFNIKSISHYSGDYIETLCFNDSIIFMADGYMIECYLFSGSFYSPIEETDIDYCPDCMVIVDSILIVGDCGLGIFLYNIEDDYSLSEFYNNNALYPDTVIVYGDYLIIEGGRGIGVFSISSDSLIQHSLYPVNAERISLYEDMIAYISGSTVGLLDLSDIYNPSLVCEKDLSIEYIVDVAYYDNILYVTSGDGYANHTHYLFKYAYDSICGFLPEGIYTDEETKGDILCFDDYIFVASNNRKFLIFNK